MILHFVFIIILCSDFQYHRKWVLYLYGAVFIVLWFWTSWLVNLKEYSCVEIIKIQWLQRSSNVVYNNNYSNLLSLHVMDTNISIILFYFIFRIVSVAYLAIKQNFFNRHRWQRKHFRRIQSLIGMQYCMLVDRPNYGQYNLF